jgi:hypothetical protein
MFLFSKAETSSAAHTASIQWLLGTFVLAEGGKQPGCKAQAAAKNERIIPPLPYMPSWQTQGQHPFTFYSNYLFIYLNNN